MSKKPRLIAIDHGNANIKTKNYVFPAGYAECGHLPNLGNQDILAYEGKEYTLSSKRMTRRNNKTKDQGHFILTLFAIGKELLSDQSEDFVKEQVAGGAVKISLAVGLPPEFMKEGADDFRTYLHRKGQIEFKLNTVRFCIEIADVGVFPQAYAAVRTILDDIKDVRTINVVDIGGYTIDCLRLEDLSPDVDTIVSLPKGVDTLFAKINQKVRAKMEQELRDTTMEGVLLKDAKFLNTINTPAEDISLIQTEAKGYTNDVLMSVARIGLDLHKDTTVFIGGGSLLIRDYIIESGMVKKPIFTENVHANAVGYEIIYNAMNK